MLLALIFAAYVALALIYHSWSPIDWNGTKQTQVGDGTTDTPNTDDKEPNGNADTGNNVVLTNGEENGISLSSMRIAAEEYEDYGISPQAETAYEFTATAYSDKGDTIAVPQDMEITGTWKNASSTWASGQDVAQHLLIEQTEVNKFRVSCLQAFGEPIILTVKSAFSDASATKQFDYIKRVSDVKITPTAGKVVLEERAFFTYEINYGVGTIEGKVNISSLYGFLSDDYIRAIVDSSYYNRFIQQCEADEYDGENWDAGYICPENNSFELTEAIVLSFNIEQMYLSNLDKWEVDCIKSATDNFEYFKYAMADALNQMSDNKQFYINYEWCYTYDGAEYSSQTAEIQLSFAVDVTLPKITNVTVSGDYNFVF